MMHLYIQNYIMYIVHVKAQLPEQVIIYMLHIVIYNMS